MILIIDNFDSFTFNLVDYFHQLGIKSMVVRNNIPVKDIDMTHIKGIVLSPGPETPQKAGFLMQYIEAYATKYPMLGICLGHQAIGEYFGAQLTKAKLPLHGKVSLIKHSQGDLFKNIPAQFNAVRYHSLVLNDLPECLESLAVSEEGENMAIKHSVLPLYGIQYHPESILTEFGLTILQNWINLLNIEV